MLAMIIEPALASEFHVVSALNAAALYCASLLVTAKYLPLMLPAFEVLNHLVV